MTLEEEERAHERRKGEEWGTYKTKLEEIDKDLKQLIITVSGLNEKYAMKLVEKIVFSACALALMTIGGAALAYLVKRP